MNRKFNIFMVALLAFVTLSFTSCKDDDFGDSIFDTTNYPLDRTKYTFPLDTFLKVNYLEPYNLNFIYRMQDIASDLNKNLVPASYEKSVELAVLTKYLWQDVYVENAGEDFLKVNSPRIIHAIGSKNYNPSQGSEVMGVAEGGLKITFYNTNGLNVKNIEMMNHYFFGTMHHEFGHILDQHVLHPLSFNTLSSGHYNSTWTETPDSVSAGWGFTSSYASSSPNEDWVETLANYITRDSISWANLLTSASYEWEEVDYDKAIYEDKMKVRPFNRDTIGYLNTKDNGEKKIYRRVCQRNGDDAQTVVLDADGNVQWLHRSGVFGDKLILQKVDMVRAWLKDNWNIDLESLRKSVQERLYVHRPDGTFVKDDFTGMFINRLLQPSDEDPTRTNIEVLTDQVYKYKELQPNK